MTAEALRYMARVLKGFHSFTCTPTRSSAIGMSHTCLPSQPQLPTPKGWKAECEVAQAEMRTCNLPIANPTLCHRATSAPSRYIQWLSVRDTPVDVKEKTNYNVYSVEMLSLRRLEIKQNRCSLADSAKQQFADVCTQAQNVQKTKFKLFV